MEFTIVGPRFNEDAIKYVFDITDNSFGNFIYSSTLEIDVQLFEIGFPLKLELVQWLTRHKIQGDDISKVLRHCSLNAGFMDGMKPFELTNFKPNMEKLNG